MGLGMSLLALGFTIISAAWSIPLLGFSAAGVIAGSRAAAAQSALYGGATRGVFSVLQSAGARMAWVPVARAGAGIAALGGTIRRFRPR